MPSELLCSQWIESYLRIRGIEYFRGQRDSDYFFIAKAVCGALHVHLAEAAYGRSMSVQVTVPRFFPAADRRRLMRLARRWNRRGGLIKVVLYRSVDPTRIGVVAEGFVPVGCGVGFEEFTVAVDASIAGGAEFFGEVAALLEVAHGHSRQAWLPDAS